MAIGYSLTVIIKMVATSVYTVTAIAASCTGGSVLYAGSCFFGAAGFAGAPTLRFAGGAYAASFAC
jgi:hypothetical protein